MWLAVSQFPDQGLPSSESQNPNHEATRELPQGFFWIWLLLFSIMSKRFSHVFVCISNLFFFFITIWYSVLSLYHNLFIHLDLSHFFQFLATNLESICKSHIWLRTCIQNIWRTFKIQQYKNNSMKKWAKDWHVTAEDMWMA